MGSLADDTRWMDATDQAALVRSGEATAFELAEAAIERIEAFDGPINAVIMKWYDHARETWRPPRSCRTVRSAVFRFS